MRSKNPSHSPSLSFGLYALVAFLAFSPCLLLGRAYFDNDLLAQFGPWRAFLKSQLAAGHFPLWNPYNLGGMPFFADLQNMMLYPFNYLTLPFSVPYGLSLFFFIHMFWAAAGMDLWLGSLGLSRDARRLGALLFASSGFFWLEIIHPPVLAAYTWLPWFFWSLEKFSSRRMPRDAFLAGLSFAMLFLCGSFQVTLGALYGGGAFFLFRLLTRGHSPRGNVKSLAVGCLLLLWGAFPLMGQLIPTLELSSLSDRTLAAKSADQLDPGLSLDPKTLYQLLLPRFTLPEDQPLAEAYQEPGKNPALTANLGFLGCWLPLLAAAAFRRREKKLLIFFAVLSLLTLAVCFGHFLPVHAWLFKLLPGFSLILVPFRFIYLFVLGAVVLAAFGFEQWISDPAERGRSLKGPLLFALVLGAAALIHPRQNWREIAALGLGLAGMAALRLQARRREGLLLLQAALLLPLLFNGWACFLPGPSSNFDFAANSRSIIDIGKKVSPYRVLFDNPNLKYPIEVQGKKYLVNYPQNAACALGIKNFGGYNPLILKTKKDIGALSLKPLLQLGAIQGILTQENRGKFPGFNLEAHPPYFFYSSQKPPVYALAPEMGRVIPDASQLGDVLQRPDFDPGHQALFLSPPPSLPTSSPSPRPADLQCVLVKDGVDEQFFLVNLSRDGWVVFSEMMYPGWKAKVDGIPAPIAIADLAFRALYLKAGLRQIDFHFQPSWVQPLRWAFFLWLALTALLWRTILIPEESPSARNPLLTFLKKTAHSLGGRGLGRIKPLRALYDLCFELLRPRSVMVQGHRMWLDDKDTLELATREIYEPMETELFLRGIKQGNVVLDIGANIGYYTLLAARKVGPQGKVYAFEPDPVNFQLLKKNIEANGYQNVVLVNKAVSDRTKTLKLFRSETNRGDHRVYDSKDGRSSISIQAVALDDLFKKIDKTVQFIKMDIQGSEAAALDGMKGLIRKNRPLKLVTEFSPGSLRLCGSSPEKYLQTLKKLGFKLREISEKDKAVRSVDLKRLPQLLGDDSNSYTNLYGVKSH